MSTREPSQSVAGDSASEALIVTYLRDHPDFFERHPELLARIRVPHASGSAVSLIEHQVGVLRGQLDTERNRLSHLISRAREFEQNSARLHGLVLQLIAAQSLADIRDALNVALRKEFNAAAVTLKLFTISTESAAEDSQARAFLDFVERDTSLCGPVDQDKNQFLFGDQSQRIRSAALIPIRADDTTGVLAIGSGDNSRFSPDMGTEMLDRLGEIVSCRLAVLPGQDLYTLRVNDLS